MNTLIKVDDCYYIVDHTGNQVVKLEKNTFGTHGHSRGYQTYRKHPDGRWIWTGIDARISKVSFEDPAHFQNLNEIRSYYGIA